MSGPDYGPDNAPPNRKFNHPDSDEAKAARAKCEADLKARERAEWVQLWRIYERCVEIAETVWGAKLAQASAQQQALAEAMRDRQITDPNWPGPMHHEIPVPLFTPRDRLQFLKEVAVNLNITAERMGLRVRFPKEAVTQNGQPEAASGTAEVEDSALPS